MRILLALLLVCAAIYAQKYNEDRAFIRGCIDGSFAMWAVMRKMESHQLTQDELRSLASMCNTRLEKSK